MFALLPLLMSLLPAIVQTVGAVETLFGKGTGAQKKQAVMDAVGIGLQVTNQVAKVRELNEPHEQQAVTAFVDKTVDAVVAAANAAKLFDRDRVAPGEPMLGPGASGGQ